MPLFLPFLPTFFLPCSPFIPPAHLNSASRRRKAFLPNFWRPSLTSTKLPLVCLFLASLLPNVLVSSATNEFSPPHTCLPPLVNIEADLAFWELLKQKGEDLKTQDFNHGTHCALQNSFFHENHSSATKDECKSCQNPLPHLETTPVLVLTSPISSGAAVCKAVQACTVVESHRQKIVRCEEAETRNFTAMLFVVVYCPKSYFDHE